MQLAIPVGAMGVEKNMRNLPNSRWIFMSVIKNDKNSPHLISQHKSARKVTYKSASLLAIYKAHLISQNQEITMTDFAVAVL